MLIKPKAWTIPPLGHMVLCVHDARLRVKQLGKCLAAARRLGTRQVIVAGDLNTEVRRGGCVAELLARDYGDHPQLPGNFCATPGRA